MFYHHTIHYVTLSVILEIIFLYNNVMRRNLGTFLVFI